MVIELEVNDYCFDVFKEISIDVKKRMGKWKFSPDDLLNILLEELLDYRQNHHIIVVNERMEELTYLEDLPYYQDKKKVQWAYWVPKNMTNKARFMLEDVNVLMDKDYKISQVLTGLVIETVNDWRKHPNKVMKKLLNLNEEEIDEVS